MTTSLQPLTTLRLFGVGFGLSSIIRKRPSDLVICMFMPPPEAAAFVKQHHVSGTRARLLLVSGPLEESERRVYSELGVDRILASDALDLTVLGAAVEEFESRLPGATEG